MEFLKNILSLIVLVSAAGIWYFIKKRPNTKYRNISIAVLISCIFIIGTFSKGNTTKTKTQNQLQHKSPHPLRLRVQRALKAQKKIKLVNQKVKQVHPKK